MVCVVGRLVSICSCRTLIGLFYHPVVGAISDSALDAYLRSGER